MEVFIFGVVLTVIVFTVRHFLNKPIEPTKDQEAPNFSAAHRIDWLENQIDNLILNWDPDGSEADHEADDLQKKEFRKERNALKRKYKSSLEETAKLEAKQRKSNKQRTDLLLYGAHNKEVLCPHCNTKGKVRTRRTKVTEETKQKGIIGSTIGMKTVTDKGYVTQFHCDNCKIKWTT